MPRKKPRLASSANTISREMISRGGDGPDSVSVSVRQIANGFVSTHTRDEDGEYHVKEEYHATRPDVEELVAGDKLSRDAEPAANSHLKDAITALNRGKA